MFGFSKKEKVVKQASNFLRPVALSIQHQSLPDMWIDPFVLGYLNGCVGIIAAAQLSNLEPADMKSLTLAVFNTFNADDAAAMVKRSTHYIQSDNEDFDAGVDVAEKILSIMNGSKDFDADPEVMEARRIAQGEPARSEDRFIGALLVIALFSKIAQRFKVEWKPGGL